MQVGQKVFVVRYMRWGNRNQYRAGVVSKVTPSGLVDVTSGSYATRFKNNARPGSVREDWREYGKRYECECIDTEMTFEQRQARLETELRIDRAAAALYELHPTTERRRYENKEELLQEVERLQKMLVEANLLVQAV